MPLPQEIDPYMDPCDLVDRWTIHPKLADGLVMMSRQLPFRIAIISGYRTPERQVELREEGRPAADPALSTHLSCPAGGADLRPDVAVTEAVKAQLGAAAVLSGLRWGGGSPVDENGIPSDWNHVDLGPRSTYGWDR